MSENGRKRRDFLRTAGLSAIALGSGCSLFLKKRETDLKVPADRKQVDLSFATYPVLNTVGGEVILTQNETSILVYRRTEDTFGAIDITCTHWGCHVRYSPKKDDIFCPCHGSRFSTGGAVTEGPAEENLRSYPVTTTANGVQISLRD
ncbi:MAG: hypothetical protein CMH54_11080 [Myxococcales bacterium]|nr:hypothetical protein [Myxococcales bacterium]